MITDKDLSKKVINDFGEEWKTFDQSNIDTKELEKLFNNYFHIFPKNELNENAIGFDLGCGSGRWAKFIAPRVKILNCIDPSTLAIQVARKNLMDFKNVKFFNSKISENILEENSQDFGYCLGVLHHTDEVLEGLKFSNKILKKNAPYLIYLYYNFDNRNLIYKSIWKISNLLRLFISNTPFKIKKLLTDIIALTIYYPLARFSLMLNFLGLNTDNIPLSFYKNESLYTMRTDSLDRFGTKLEKRFSKKEISKLLYSSGFKEVKFSEIMPFWVAICKKK